MMLSDANVKDDFKTLYLGDQRKGVKVSNMALGRRVSAAKNLFSKGKKKTLVSPARQRSMPSVARNTIMGTLDNTIVGGRENEEEKGKGNEEEEGKGKGDEEEKKKGEGGDEDIISYRRVSVTNSNIQRVDLKKG